MSYAASGALQAAVHARLATDPALQALVGDAVWDEPPAGTTAETWVAIGEERARNRADASGGLMVLDLTVSVTSRASGFAAAKAVAGEVVRILDGAQLALSAGRLVWLQFRAARARRIDGGARRRVDIVFRAGVEGL